MSCSSRLVAAVRSFGRVREVGQSVFRNNAHATSPNACRRLPELAKSGWCCRKAADFWPDLAEIGPKVVELRRKLTQAWANLIDTGTNWPGLEKLNRDPAKIGPKSDEFGPDSANIDAEPTKRNFGRLRSMLDRIRPNLTQSAVSAWTIVERLGPEFDRIWADFCQFWATRAAEQEEYPSTCHEESGAHPMFCRRL